MTERRISFEPTRHFANDWRVVSSDAVLLNGRLIGRIWAVQERAEDSPEWRYRGGPKAVSGRGLSSRDEAIEGLVGHFSRRPKIF